MIIFLLSTYYDIFLLDTYFGNMISFHYLTLLMFFNQALENNLDLLIKFTKT